MRRELSEETGIAWSDVTVIDVCGEWLGYELPVAVRSAKTGQSQVHRWFLLRWERTEDMRVLDRTVEFDRWQWMPWPTLSARPGRRGSRSTAAWRTCGRITLRRDPAPLRVDAEVFSDLR